jgi:aldehyde:ferredoxin oxidoreductase
MKGNTGKIIKVDLTEKHCGIENLPGSWYSKYIGGSGLAAKYFFENGDFKADPLSPESLLIIMNGPMAGLKISGASRCCVAGCSPLTGNWGDSSCGGYFAPELRYAGYDGIVITGRATNPLMLVIEDDAPKLVDAEKYWGKGIDEVHRSLKDSFSAVYRNMLIGPAGENCVRYAAIISDNHHAFGRAGFGAVMGSKNLKGVLVRASRREMNVADPDASQKLLKELKGKIKEYPVTTMLHTDGTAGVLEGAMFLGDVPIQNFTSNANNEEMAKGLSGATLTEKYLTKRHACAFCSIACKRVVEIKEGSFAIPEGPGPEYETITALGSLLNSKDLAAACKAGRICNDLGLDSISAGSTIAWAMEAFEKGDLTLAETGGIPLVWADMQTVVDEVLPKIAAREGKLGKLLAEGSVRAAAAIGKGMEYTAHSKGLEAPMHDPRGGGHGMALSYAIGPRGACHVADWMLTMEYGGCFMPEIGFQYQLTQLTDTNKPEAAAIAVALGGIENSACFCHFADLSFSITEWVALFNSVAGYDWTISDMMNAGRRVFFIKRLINHRYGLTAADDLLTPRLLEPARDGVPAGVKIEFDSMKKRFYQLMDMDEISGIPCRDSLIAIDMTEEATRIKRSIF